MTSMHACRSLLAVVATAAGAAAPAVEVPVWFGTSTSAKTASEGIYAATFDTESGRLTPRGAEPSGGGGPCHVAVDPEGRVVLAANYGGGSVICLGLDADGRPKPVVNAEGRAGFLQHVEDRAGEPGIDPRRQEKAHVHRHVDRRAGPRLRRVQAGAVRRSSR